MSERNYPAACAKLAASLDLEPGIGTRLYLAECFERNGQLASAWEQFRAAAGAAARVGDAREKVALTRAATLEPRLSRLAIVVEARCRGLAAVDAWCRGLAVERDGIPVDLAAGELPIDPGKHVVTARAPGRKTWREVVDATHDGARVEVVVPELESEEAPPNAVRSGVERIRPAPQSSTPSRSPETRKVVGVVLLGVGALALGAGSYLGVSAKAMWDDASPRCPGACDREGFDQRNAAKGRATGATVAFLTGAAAVGVGAVMLLVFPRVTPRYVTRGIRLGAFLDRDAGMFMLTGAWR